MELFGSYTSPYVRHCRVVLLQLEQPFTFVETDNATSAQRSPTQRVPFLRDGERFLTDSSTILQYVRSRAGQPFLADIDDCERFHLATTALSSCVNIFQLEKDGIGGAQSAYLRREAERLKSTLSTLDRGDLTVSGSASDSLLRLACFLEWALFRKRISLDAYPSLVSFLERAQRIARFAETAPPAG